MLRRPDTGVLDVMIGNRPSRNLGRIATAFFTILIAVLGCGLGQITHAQDFDGMFRRIQSFQALGEFGKALSEAKRLEAAASRLGAEQQARIAALGQLGQCYEDVGAYADAERSYRRAVEIATRIRDPDTVSLSGNLAISVRRQGRYLEAEALFRHAIAAGEPVLGPDHPDVVKSLNGLADTLRLRGQYPEAEALFRRVLAVRERTLGANNADTGQALGGLANTLSAEGHHAEADGLQRRAIAIQEKVSGRDHPDVGILLNNLAASLIHQARYGEAEATLRRVLAIQRRALKARNPDLASTLVNLAVAVQRQGRYAEAEPLIRQALAIREIALGPTHPGTTRAQLDLAANLSARGLYAEAVRLERQALATEEATLGPDHPDVGATLINLGDDLRVSGWHVEAEAMHRRALAIREKALGPNHADVGASVSGLASDLYEQGRYAEAELLHRRALTIREQALGPDHPDVGSALNELANDAERQGRYGDAEALYRRGLAVRERALGPDHPDVKSSLVDLANDLLAQGRYKEAEALYGRALAIAERTLGPDHAQVGTTLNNLAVKLIMQGRAPEADALLRRALAIREKALSPVHADVGQTLQNLASSAFLQDRQAEAEALARRALAVRERALGPDHSDVGFTLDLLGRILLKQGQSSDAEVLVRRAVAIQERTFGPNHPNVAPALNELADALQARGQFADAAPLLQRAIAIRETALDPGNPEVSDARDALSRSFEGAGELGAALTWARKASASLLLFAEREATSGTPADELGRRLNIFHHHLGLLMRASKAGSEPAEALAGEAFEIAQHAGQSQAAAALNQMTARFAAGSGRLADLSRDVQNLSARRTALEQRLLAALAGPASKQDSFILTGIHQDITALDAQSRDHLAELRRDFPQYAQLVHPAPFALKSAQRLLGPDEAMVFFLTGDETVSFVFALTRENATWDTIPLGRAAMTERVTAFRRGLDVNEFLGSESEKPTLFDLTLAREMHEILLGPVDRLVADRHHLIVVPTGPLTALPFHLLVARGSATPSAQDYRGAAWLIRAHAVSVLPSVNSLKALRDNPRGIPASRTFIGFGDPVFTAALPGPREVRAGAGRRGDRAAAVTRAAYSSVWREGGIDRSRLSEVLVPLPETADELRAVAARLGAPENDLYLQASASEAQVKRAPLVDYRVVYFATHGLVSGEVRGVGEPALALSLPSEPSALDDGLLTASEVAQLRLNADWVVLSACNTAAGERPGAEALSGLVRSFFYAGARALLVSHWAIPSRSAVRLTTASFSLLAAEPGLGRAEALRRAMVSYLDDLSEPLNAYPAFWGAFEVVGEGTAH